MPANTAVLAARGRAAAAVAVARASGDAEALADALAFLDDARAATTVEAAEAAADSAWDAAEGRIG